MENSEINTKLDKIIALLEGIKKTTPAQHKQPQQGTQKFECEILEDEAKPSGNGDWVRFRAKVPLEGFSRPQYCTVWIRTEKADLVMQPSTITVEGRVDGREYNGKTYYSIFVDHLVETSMPPELKEEEDDDDIPF